MLILITGASGSGTSTLGAALAKELGIAHLDADDYYWLPTVPPFTTKRDRAERLSFILRDVRAKKNAVLAGSVMEWGDELENAFEVFDSRSSWEKYALESLKTVQLAAKDLGLKNRLHLWPDKSLGSAQIVSRMSRPAEYQKWLFRWWNRISEWPR